MAIELESVVQVGNRRVAALVRRTAASHGGRRGLHAWISKQPLAILIAEGAEMRALDMFGNPVSLDEVERLRPGAISAFRRPAE